ncbi:MAG: zinc-binding alcohol dehydrogenase family protein [Asticcacaulis sp.]
MKAVVCEAPSALGIAEKPVPVRRSGETLIRISRVGLCGTDYHIFTGNQPFLEYPRIMGHELAGTVAEADPDSLFKAGQLVTINPYLPCGQCIACRKAKPNCCVHIKVLGVHTDGGMTEFISVPTHAVIPVDGLTPDQAAMVEFLSIGAHAVRRAQIQPQERVLIVGAGPIGVAAGLFARMAGALITLIDTSADRLEYARSRLGFDDTLDVDETLKASLEARTDGDYFDVVFDATGSARAIENGFQFVAHGGRYVLISVVKDSIRFSDPEFHKREMQLIGSRNATHEDFAQVIKAIRDGDIPTDALKTHTFPLMETPVKIKELIAHQGHVLKAIATL